jgi:hypothetical protein
MVMCEVSPPAAELNPRASAAYARKHVISPAQTRRCSANVAYRIADERRPRNTSDARGRSGSHHAELRRRSLVAPPQPQDPQAIRLPSGLNERRAE